MPDVGVQIPPNLSDWWLPLVEEGATDLGGLSANGDHISPEHPFPSVHRMRKQLQPRGYALTERLCVYPQYMDPEWMEQGVLDVIKLQLLVASSRGAARAGATSARSARELVPGAVARAREGAALTRGGADRAVRRDPPGGDRGHAPGGRRAARASWPATRSRSWSTATSTSPTSASSAARSAASGRAGARPTPTSTPRTEFRRRVREAVEFGATEICMQSGIHPDWSIEDYERWLRVAKDEAPGDPPARVLADGGRRDGRRPAAGGGVRPAARRRPRLDARAPRPRCSTTACASGSRRTSCRWRAGSR